MSEDHVPQLSIVSTTANGFGSLLVTYRTLVTNLDIEIIYVGPTNYLDDSLIPTPHKFVVSSVKPVQACQIGMFLARGETVGVMADDQVFSPYAWDEAYALYKESNDYKTIVSMGWWEHNQNYRYKLIRFGLQLPTPCSVMSRKFFQELGGYDSGFVFKQAHLEIFFRAIKQGATIVYCPDEYMKGVSEPDTGRPQYFSPGDSELYENKWIVEGGVLVQKIQDQLFEFNDTIYTVSQGTKDSKWP